MPSLNSTLTALAAQTIAAAGTTTGPDLQNYEFSGAYFHLEVANWATDIAITDLIVQAKLPDGTYQTIFDWSALGINANGTYSFLMYPMAGSTGALKAAPASLPLPGTFRVQLVTTRTTGAGLTATVLVQLQN